MNQLNSPMIDNVNTDKILTEILTRFNSTQIIEIVRESINLRFRPYNTGIPSINAYESYFTQLHSYLPAQNHSEIIDSVRSQTYDEIINEICRYFNLTYTPMEGVDNYKICFWLYEVLVSHFTDTLIRFFVNFIITYTDEIYKELSIQSQNNEEEMNAYSKKIYSIEELAVIHNNITIVMDNISTRDITLPIMLQFINASPECISIINNCIGENSNTFYTYFCCYLRDIGTRPDLITNVKLALQEYAQNDINIIKKQKG